MISSTLRMIGLIFTTACASGAVVLGSSQAQPLPESPNSSIGYPSVATALADLRARSEIEFSTQNGWTIAVDEHTRTIWSFSPSTYPAYPAVVKRHVKPNETGGSTIEMSVLCEAEKEPCDELVRTFDQMTAQRFGPLVGPPQFR